MTVRTNAFVMSATIFKYHESVIFSISRARALHWQRSQRSSWACPHGEERGEKHGDYREERRT
jgi:dTDP-4-dehydrorhamnose 3,5-epimerase-like enzyme